MKYGTFTTGGLVVMMAVGCSAENSPPATVTVTQPPVSITKTVTISATPSPTSFSSSPSSTSKAPPSDEDKLVSQVRKADPEARDEDEDMIVSGAELFCEQMSDIGLDETDPTARYIIEEFPFDILRAPAYARYGCPGVISGAERAAGGFGEGDSAVGETPGDIRPGTYRTKRKMTDCYWERTTSGGDTIANDFVTNAPGGVTVTILASDGGFSSDGCGAWLPVK